MKDTKDAKGTEWPIIHNHRSKATHMSINYTNRSAVFSIHKLCVPFFLQPCQTTWQAFIGDRWSWLRQDEHTPTVIHTHTNTNTYTPTNSSRLLNLNTFIFTDETKVFWSLGCLNASLLVVFYTTCVSFVVRERTKM